MQPSVAYSLTLPTPSVTAERDSPAWQPVTLPRTGVLDGAPRGAVEQLMELRRSMYFQPTTIPLDILTHGA